ncbi:putative transporter component [Spongiibacter sp. IMCC21906]|jgi:uncharacterized membrane protein YedE/YeeE|uniref:YeeE/YedE family protein n=1 Tax=Spongiibacter sp. IMCC21906 TaxID=1620392 RepID=UPI00062DD7BD|nr:YeeE/YedE family protein [Spongiibacter sp. IMCC21906]AKH69475.1 putative transporter component [Spongiibacter sp. IMCC21906]
MVPATEFTPLISVIGGVLIGASALLLMWSVGRIAGISGIVGGALTQKGSERSWRLVFIAGLFLGGFLAAYFSGALEGVQPVSAWPVLLLAGLLVGFGTRMGSGCTSGHGICGLSRFSKRSLWATVTFMASGFVTVFVLRHVIGA